MTLTPERLAEIKARCDGVQPDAPVNGLDDGLARIGAFVDAATVDIPDLIARIEELERDNAALEAQVEALKGEGGEPRTTAVLEALAALPLEDEA